MDDSQDFTEPVLGNGVDGGIFECSTCSLVHHRVSALLQAVIGSLAASFNQILVCPWTSLIADHHRVSVVSPPINNSLCRWEKLQGAL